MVVVVSLATRRHIILSKYRTSDCVSEADDHDFVSKISSNNHTKHEFPNVMISFSIDDLLDSRIEN
jgi:hypothetical protein